MEIEILDAENLSEFLANPNCLLILSKSDCVACNAWKAELEKAMEAGQYPESIPVGKLNLDQRGLGDFKRENSWLQEVKDLPYNLIYKSGTVEKKYVGGGLDRLTNRLRRLELIEA